MHTLRVKAFALAVGCTWGLGMFFAGMLAAYGPGGQFVSTFGSIYIGYAPGFIGSIIGGIWGFVDGAIAGAILAWIYNAIA